MPLYPHFSITIATSQSGIQVENFASKEAALRIFDDLAHHEDVLAAELIEVFGPGYTDFHQLASTGEY